MSPCPIPTLRKCRCHWFSAAPARVNVFCLLHCRPASLPGPAALLPAWLRLTLARSAPALLPLLSRCLAGAAHRRLPSHLHNPKRGKLVLMLLAAQAANRLLDALELDAMSVLEQRSTEEGTALVLDLVVQTHPAGVCVGDIGRWG